MTPQDKHDVFISYSSADAAWAQAAVAALEEMGVRCWIAPRDIVGGETWAGAIVTAIGSCRLMILMFSRASNDSPQVTRELVLASERHVHVLPLRVDEVQPSNDKAYYLSAAHWLTVLGGPTDENLEQLCKDVRRLLAMPAPAIGGTSGPTAKRRAKSARARKWTIVAVSAAAAVGLVTWRVVANQSHASENDDPRPPVDPKPVRDDERADRNKGGGNGFEIGPQPPKDEKLVQGTSKDDLHETKPVNADNEAKTAKENETEAATVDPSKDPRWKRVPDSLRKAFVPLGSEWIDTAGRTLPARARHVATGMEFVLVRAGEFELGARSTDIDARDEQPTRRVKMSAFYIARWEVSAAQYSGRADDGDLPITQLTERQAEDWCAMHGLALPTEAQWEYAASGPEDRAYPWGQVWNAEKCNAIGSSDSFPRLAPIGRFALGASWCGAEDMAGNVAEWCRGSYAPGYDEHLGELDPEPPSQDSQRVARGGAWSDRKDLLRTSDRRPYPPNARDGYVGFRCVFVP